MPLGIAAPRIVQFLEKIRKTLHGPLLVKSVPFRRIRLPHALASLRPRDGHHDPPILGSFILGRVMQSGRHSRRSDRDRSETTSFGFAAGENEVPR